MPSLGNLVTLLATLGDYRSKTIVISVIGKSVTQSSGDIQSIVEAPLTTEKRDAFQERVRNEALKHWPNLGSVEGLCFDWDG